MELAESVTLMEEDDTNGRPNRIMGFAPQLDSELKPLIDKENDYIVLGRSTGEHEDFGSRGLMDIGVVGESQTVGENHLSRRIMIDNQFPHILFICGKRGSGKSYTLGLFAEELAKSTEGIGTVLIDPIGIFWSLKRENVSSKEIKLLGSFGLRPMDFDNVSVLTPLGYEEGMEPVTDGSFSIGVHEMTAADWCNVFDLDRFKAQGLLIGDVVSKVRDGYIAVYGNRKIEMPGKADQYSIGDLIQCIEHDEAFQSKKKGYATSTRRSIAARFHAVGNWGLFSKDGTPMRTITSPNTVTVIDVSHPKLDNDRRALIVGILARKILEGRIQASKREEARSLGMQLSLEGSLPVTWLLIDEAHLILPRGGKTTATDALVEYAKLGRKPGCGLVLATQRPAATDDNVLSQVDMMISHNLALEEDMTSLRKRLPSKVPPSLVTSDFIRAIPVGMGIVADQKTQNRTMLVKFRPRQSYHSGKAAVPTMMTGMEPDPGEGETEVHTIPKSNGEVTSGSILSPSLNVDQLLFQMESGQEVKKVKSDPIFVIRGEDILLKDKTGSVKDQETGPEQEAGDLQETERTEADGKEKPEEKTEDEDRSVVEDKHPAKTGSPSYPAEKESGRVDDDKVKKVLDDIIDMIAEPQEGDESPEKLEDTSSGAETGGLETGDEIEKEYLESFNLESGSDEAVQEEKREPTSLSELQKEVLSLGHHYLFKNEDRGMAQTFVKEIAERSDCALLVISRAPRQRIEATFGDHLNTSYWLSKTDTKESLNPHNLEKITYTIGEFLEGNRGTLVYFDGLEYLISNNDFQKVMRFIETLHEKCQLSEGVIVFPFTPEVISKRDMTQVQTEMDVLFEKEDLLPFSLGTTVEDDGAVIEEKEEEVEETHIAAEEEPDAAMDEVSWEEESKVHGGEMSVEEGVKDEDSDGGIPGADPEAEDQDGETPEKPPKSGFDIEYLSRFIDKEKKKGDKAERTSEEPLPKPSVKKSPRESDGEPKLRPEVRLDKTYLRRTASSDHVTEKDARTVKVPSIETHGVVDAEFTEVPPEAPRPRALQKKKEKPKKKEKARRDMGAKRKGREIEKNLREESPLEEETSEDGLAVEEYMSEGEGHLITIPMITDGGAEEEARRYLEKQGIFKRKTIEMVSDVKLIFVPIMRLFLSKSAGLIKKKQKVFTLFFDMVTGELVTKYRRGLVRTTNLPLLFKYPKTQVTLLSYLGSGLLADIELEARTKLRPQDIRRALNALEKDGMIEKKVSSDGFYRYRRKTELDIPARFDRASPDMPYIREGRLCVEAVKPRFKRKDIENLVNILGDGFTFVDNDIIYYPYYLVSVEGKRGPRKIYIDGINGKNDELLGTIKKYKTGIPK